MIPTTPLWLTHHLLAAAWKPILECLHPALLVFVFQLFSYVHASSIKVPRCQTQGTLVLTTEICQQCLTVLLVQLPIINVPVVKAISLGMKWYLHAVRKIGWMHTYIWPEHLDKQSTTMYICTYVYSWSQHVHIIQVSQL